MGTSGYSRSIAYSLHHYMCCIQYRHLEMISIADWLYVDAWGSTSFQTAFMLVKADAFCWTFAGSFNFGRMYCNWTMWLEPNHYLCLVSSLPVSLKFEVNLTLWPLDVSEFCDFTSAPTSANWCMWVGFKFKLADCIYCLGAIVTTWGSDTGSDTGTGIQAQQHEL